MTQHASMLHTQASVNNAYSTVTVSCWTVHNDGRSRPMPTMGCISHSANSEAWSRSFTYVIVFMSWALFTGKWRNVWWLMVLMHGFDCECAIHGLLMTPKIQSRRSVYLCIIQVSSRGAWVVRSCSQPCVISSQRSNHCMGYRSQQKYLWALRDQHRSLYSLHKYDYIRNDSSKFTRRWERRHSEHMKPFNACHTLTLI